MTWKTQLKKISTDRISGASSIATRTAQMVQEMCEVEPFDDVQGLLDLLQEAAYGMICGQPEMASIVGLLNNLFFAATSARDYAAALDRVQKTATSFVEEMEKARRDVVRKARGLLPADVSVLTHSYSSTISAALITAVQSGRHLKVYCHESRPRYEGRRMARELSEAGIEVIFAIDAAIYANLTQCELVLVGADSLTEQGVMNKIGTAALAVSAQTLSIPVYVLADTTKIWPSGLGSPIVSTHPAHEIWENFQDDVTVINSYFDLAPWPAIAGVVTEHGLMTTAEIRTASRDRPVHPNMQALIAEVRSTI